MYSKNFPPIAIILGIILIFTTFLEGQITIDYPESVTVPCGANLRPSPRNGLLSYPVVTTTCASGVEEINYSDNLNSLTECGGTGVLLRFWSVTDNCGGFSTLLQRITLIDTVAPVIECEEVLVIDCEDDLNPALNPDLSFPTVIDCSKEEDLIITYTDKNEGIGFCQGLPDLVRRTWTVTDGCGNSSTCEQRIIVGFDPLLVTCEPDDFEHECNGLDGSRFAAEAWDLGNANELRGCVQSECGGVEVISDFDFGRIAGPCGITGQLEVNYLVRDNCGNAKFFSAVFTLSDTTAPESFCNPIGLPVDCGGVAGENNQRVADWHQDNFDLLETCIFDNCGEVTISSDFDPNTFNVNNLTFDCNDTIGFAVDYILADECGNTNILTGFIRLVDFNVPQFEDVPRDTVVGAGTILPVFDPFVVDNCSEGLFPEFFETRENNEADDGFTLVRSWAATDDCGNADTISQRIKVLNSQLTLACTAASIQLEGNQIVISNLLAPNERIKVTADGGRIDYNCFRNCGDVQTTRELVDDIYKVEIEFLSEDFELICRDEKIITVGDGGDGEGFGDPCDRLGCEQEPPTISNLPPDLTVNYLAVPTPQNPTATDNCDTDVAITLNETRTNGINANNYVLTRTWTATDDCGNAIEGMQVIRVVEEGGSSDGNNTPCSSADCEDIPPVLSGVPANTSADASAVPAPAQPTATDNCDLDVNIELIEFVSESTDSRNYTLNRLWTATDDCGNESSATQIIIVTGSDTGGSGSGGNTGGSGSGGNTGGSGSGGNTGGSGSGGNTGGSGSGGNTGGSGSGGTGGTSGSLCDQISISTGTSTFNFSNLNAANKIIKVFDTDYNIILECNDNCGSEVNFSYDIPGTYIADVLLYSADWELVCEKRETVVLSNTPGNSGGGGTGSGDCSTVSIQMGSGLITINNLNSENKIVKLFDENFNTLAECSNNCGNQVIFNTPADGNYTVDVRLYNVNWELICDKQESINIAGSSGGNTGGDNSGGGNGSNGNSCANVSITGTQSAINITNFNAANKIINVFDIDYNLVYNCFIGCETDVTAPIPTLGVYLIDIQLYTADWTLICQQQRSIEISENSNQGDNNTGNTGSNLSCGDVQIDTEDAEVRLSNVGTSNAIIKIFDQTYNTVFECTGNCGGNAIVNNVANGKYEVFINFYDENWQETCQRMESIRVGMEITASENPFPSNTSNSRILLEENGPLNFALYPNPASDEITLVLQGYIGQEATLSIYNQLGARVLQKTVATNNNTLQIDLQDLESGLYIISMRGAENVPVAKKLLVNKTK